MSRARLLHRGLDSSYLREFLRPETTWIMPGNASPSPSPYSGLICLHNRAFVAEHFAERWHFGVKQNMVGLIQSEAGSRHKSPVMLMRDQIKNQDGINIITTDINITNPRWAVICTVDLIPFKKLTTAKIDSTRNTTKLSLWSNLHTGDNLHIELKLF